MTTWKPTHLYVMKHLVTGKMYFGKTNRKNINNYLGSGSYWTNHIMKHGKAHVVRTWARLFENETECKEFAIAFSELFDIVSSDLWANQIPEDGLDGHAKGFTQSEETRNKISNSLIGKPSPKSQYIIKEDSSVRSDRIHRQHINSIFINNGVTTIRIKSYETIPDGFVIGRIKGSNNLKFETCIYCDAYMANYHITRYHNDNCKYFGKTKEEILKSKEDEILESKKVRSDLMSDRIFINDGVYMKRIKTNISIPEGWQIGRLKESSPRQIKYDACNRCGAIMSIAALTRYHNDNCKVNKNDE